MRKAAILVVLALAIAGSIYLLSTESPRGSTPEHASTSVPETDESRSDNAPGTGHDEAAWLKLRDRLNERMAEAPNRRRSGTRPGTSRSALSAVVRGSG